MPVELCKVVHVMSFPSLACRELIPAAQGPCGPPTQNHGSQASMLAGTKVQCAHPFKGKYFH